MVFYIFRPKKEGFLTGPRIRRTRYKVGTISRERKPHIQSLYYQQKGVKEGVLSRQGESTPIHCHESGVMMTPPEVPTLIALIQRRDNASM